MLKLVPSFLKSKVNNRPLTYMDALTYLYLIYGCSLNENNHVEINAKEMRTMKLFMENLLNKWVNLNMSIYYYA